jgi:hypothetical protein
MTDIIAHAKSLADLIKKANDQELYRRIVDLQAEILEQSGKLMELFTTNRQLQEKLDQRAKLAFKRPFYFSEGDAIPHCAHCWESKQLLVHLECNNPQHVTEWICLNCDAKWSENSGSFRLTEIGSSVNPFHTRSDGVSSW